MMPAPTHLKDWVVPDNAIVDEENFIGTVRCPCSSKELKILYPGQTHEYKGEDIPCTAEINGVFFFLITVLCKLCGEKHILFDKDFHGWDGYICHDKKQASLPRPNLTEWTCLACSNVWHTAQISIETQGKDDFIEEAGDIFPAEKWIDAFSWFTMSIKCCQCGHETNDWVSYETM